MVDTIFEIGGQDSKFIRIRDGVVVDFIMNEACAAGPARFWKSKPRSWGLRLRVNSRSWLYRREARSDWVNAARFSWRGM